MATFLDFRLTQAGKQAAINASNTGIQLDITHIAFGKGHKLPAGNEIRLVDEIKRVAIGGGNRPVADQIRVWALWDVHGEAGDIYEVGIYAGDILFAYYSREDGSLIGKKVVGSDYVMYYDFKLAEIPAGSVTIVIDPSASLVLQAIRVHEDDPLAHSQYLRRSDVAADASRLYWGGLVGGTTDILELDLPTETLIESYVEGQRFHFLARYGNTGSVALRVNTLGLRSVRKNGNTALSAGDLSGGTVYEVIFDGSNFQLLGAVGGSSGSGGYEGEVFYTHPFIATAGQKSFEVPYAVGALMVFVRGDFVQPANYVATDGAHVVLNTAANVGDQVTVITFRATAAANVYTKPETYSRAEVVNLINTKQDLLGYTPVQQGGGVGHGTNKVRIGWNPTYGLKAQVDNTDLGNFWYSGNFDPNSKANKATTLGGYGIADALTATEIYGLLSGKQNSLGFTPVRQGGGTGMLPNTVFFGFNGAELVAQVDNTAFGAVWCDYSATPKVAAACAVQPAGGIGTYGLFIAILGTGSGASPIAPGALVAGSNLRWANCAASLPSQIAPSGTWRLMGLLFNADDAPHPDSTAIFLRVS